MASDLYYRRGVDSRIYRVRYTVRVDGNDCINTFLGHIIGLQGAETILQVNRRD